MSTLGTKNSNKYTKIFQIDNTIPKAHFRDIFLRLSESGFSRNIPHNYFIPMNIYSIKYFTNHE